MVPMIIRMVEIISVTSNLSFNNKNHIDNTITLVHIKYEQVFFLFFRMFLSFKIKLINQIIAINISIRNTRNCFVFGSSVAFIIFINVIISIAVVPTDIFHII